MRRSIPSILVLPARPGLHARRARGSSPIRVNRRLAGWRASVPAPARAASAVSVASTSRPHSRQRCGKRQTPSRRELAAVVGDLPEVVRRRRRPPGPGAPDRGLRPDRGGGLRRCSGPGSRASTGSPADARGRRHRRRERHDDGRHVVRAAVAVRRRGGGAATRASRSEDGGRRSPPRSTPTASSCPRTSRRSCSRSRAAASARPR